MAAAGAIAFSDDGRPVTDAALLRAAFQAAALSGLPLSLHCEDPALALGGVMNEGEVSARLGRPEFRAALNRRWWPGTWKSPYMRAHGYI